MAINDFTEMSVWQLARKIVNDVYKLTGKLPKSEDYAVSGQSRGAAVSIAGNIAEGFGRGHKKEKINFYLISRGSACEVRSHLSMGSVVGYFTEEEVELISVKCKRVVEQLNKIIRGLV